MAELRRQERERLKAKAQRQALRQQAARTSAAQRQAARVAQGKPAVSPLRFLVPVIVLALIVAAILGLSKLGSPTQQNVPADASITSCAPDGFGDDVATGTLFNNHSTYADYLITVNFYQGGVLIGTAEDTGILLNTNNEAPNTHDTWFATLKPAPPGLVTCQLASVERTDEGTL